MSPNQLCYSCNPTCLTCTDSINCISCKTPYVLLGTQCVTSCPIDYYLDTKTSITPKCTMCSAITSNCLKCS